MMPKPIEEWTAKQLQTAIEKEDARYLAISQEFIDAGRGRERPTEIVKQNDPLSLRMRESMDRTKILYDERAERMRWHGSMRPIRRENPGGRPKKYASAAERQAAYRARYAIVETRLKTETAQTLNEISASRDIARADLVADMIVWALANRDWYGAPRYTRSVAPMSRRMARDRGLIDERDDDGDL